MPSIADWTYEPDAERPGLIRFTDPDGKPTLLYGPPAAELASRIDATKAALESQKAERTAQNAHQPRFAALDRIGNFGPPEPVPPHIMDVATRGAAAPAPAPAPTQPALAPAPEGASAGPRNLGFGRRLTADGRIQRYVAGSPAVTREMLQARDEGAVAQRVAQSTTTQGGFEPSLEYLKGKLQVASEKADLLEEIRGQNMRQAIAEDQAAKDRAALAAQHQREQAQMLSEIEKRVKQDEQLYEQARKEYAESKVNPERIFQGKEGTLRALTYALSAGLGAFGATLGRTENFAQKAIDNIIEQDIRAQEAEIAIRGKNADNALAQLQRSGLSREQARTLLRQIQSDFTMARADEMRAAAKIDAENANYKALKLKHEEDTLDFLERYRRESMGTRTQQVQSQFAHPRAATGGGWVDVADQLGEGEKALDLEAKRVDIDLKRAKAAAGGADDVEVRDYKQRVAQVEEGQAALAEIAKLKGLTFNPRTNRWEGDASGTWATGVLGLDEDQAYAAQVESLAPGIGRGLEGNAPNESTMDAIKSGLLSASGNKTAEAINAYWARLQEKRRSADALVPSSVVEAQRRRQRAVDEANIKERTGVAAPAAGGGALPPPNRL